MIYSAASARRCSASIGRGEDAPSRGLIGGSEGRNFDVKTPRDIERTCPPVYGSTYDTCRYSTPSVFSNTEIPFLRYIARAVPSLPCPRFIPSRGPAMQISFSPRASVLYGTSLLSRSELFLPYAVDHSFRLSFLPPPPPPHPVVPSSLPCFRTWFLFFSLTLSSSLIPFCILLSLFRYRLSRSSTLFVFLISTAHTPTPAVFHSATPPTPSRPIQSPPRHPSFTASVAAYRLSY